MGYFAAASLESICIFKLFSGTEQKRSKVVDVDMDIQDLINNFVSPCFINIAITLFLFKMLF